MTTQQKSRAIAIKNTVIDEFNRQSPVLRANGMGDPGFVAKVFLNTIAASVGTRNDLTKCTTESLRQAAMQCSNTALLADGEQAALIKYKDEARFQPMYKGLLKLARQSGGVKSLSADVIKENDKYDYQMGTEQFLTHRPALGGRGKTIAAYCVVHYSGDNAPEITICDIDYLKRVKESSRSSGFDGSPWNTWEDSMFIKTAIRRALKLVTSQTVEMQSALQADLEADGFIDSSAATVVVETNDDADDTAAIEHQPAPEPEPEPEPKPAPEPEPTENPAPQEKAKPARQQSKNASAQKAEASPDDQFNDLF